MSRRREALEVDDLEGGVGRRLEVEEVAATGDRSFDRIEVRRVTQIDIDAEVGEELCEYLAGASVGVLHAHDSVPRPEMGVQRIRDRRHSRCRRGRRLGALEEAQLLLEDRHGRVGVPAVDVSGLSTRGDIEPVVDVVVSERDAVHDRHLGGAVDEVAVLATPHGQGAAAGILVCCHGELLGRRFR